MFTLQYVLVATKTACEYGISWHYNMQNKFLPMNHLTRIFILRRQQPIPRNLNSQSQLLLDKYQCEEAFEIIEKRTELLKFDENNYSRQKSVHDHVSVSIYIAINQCNIFKLFLEGICNDGRQVIELILVDPAKIKSLLTCEELEWNTLFLLFFQVCP